MMNPGASEWNPGAPAAPPRSLAALEQEWRARTPGAPAAPPVPPPAARPVIRPAPGVSRTITGRNAKVKESVSNFMEHLRTHVRTYGPLLGSRSDDFLKALPEGVEHPRPLKRHIQQHAASYGMRFEDRRPPDGWILELDGAPHEAGESEILTALAAWISQRESKRMRSGEIDQFYLQHKHLERRKGVSWLNDDLLGK